MAAEKEERDAIVAGDFYSSGIPWRFFEGKIQFCLVPYHNEYESGRLEHRFPGGCCKRLKGERWDYTPEDALGSEMQEETFLILVSFNRIYRRFVDSKNSPVARPGRKHPKFFYLIDEFSGVTPESFPGNGRNPLDINLEAPIWVSPKEVLEKLYWGHRWAYYEALKILVTREDRRFHSLLYDVCTLEEEFKAQRRTA